MATPGFSVITPSYNQSRYIRANIESVIAQDYPDVEHIIFDNASTDETVSILESYPTVIWRSETDSGQSDAINKALEHSTKEWVIWVNSDDFLLPGALAALADAIQQNPGTAAIISNHIRVNSAGTRISKVSPNYSPWKLRHWWWSALQLWQPGSVFKKEVFDYAGPLDTSLHYAMDFDFMLKAHARYPFYFFDADLVAFRLHDQQKGHTDEMPFINERICSTLRYWRERDATRHVLYSIVLYFAAGSLEFVQGLRRYEAGDRRQALPMIKRGLLRNPASLLRPEHLGFWIRKLIGSERYYRLR
jgi:glycosyltransferase involved in cell wall biosynthesis